MGGDQFFRKKAGLLPVKVCLDIEKKTDMCYTDKN